MQSFAHSGTDLEMGAAAGPIIRDSGAMSVKSVAQNAAVSDSTVKRAIRDGKLKAKKFGRRTLILRADFNEWLHGLPAA